MKYTVELAYSEHCFDDGATALSFAELAENSRMDESLQVPIKIILKRDEGGDTE